MVDWTDPTLTTLYAQVLTDLDDRLNEVALMFDGTSSTNIPTGALRIDISDSNKLERYGGATWDAMDLTITNDLFVLNDLTITGVLTILGDTLTANNYVFNIDQTVDGTTDTYVLTYDDASGEISLAPSTGGGGASDFLLIGA